MCACVVGSVDIPVGGSTPIFDMSIEYPYYLYEDGVLKARLCGPLPWRANVRWSTKRIVGDVIEQASSTDYSDKFTITILALSESSVTVRVVRCGPGFFGFADVAVSQRYGSDVFLDGQLSGIIESDEICIKYFRPEDGAVLNLPGELHDYTYLKGTSGTYSFDGNPHIPLWVRRLVSSRFDGDTYIPSHYIDTCLPGWYALLVHDVSGTCETVISERVSHPFELVAPRYQYQVVFDPDDFDFPDQLHLLMGRLAQWDTVDDMVLNRSIKDCWVVKLLRAGVWDAEYSHVWLCAAVQLEVDAFCYPLPYWLCQRDPIVHKYWRGECDCEEFQMYGKYGIPCCHLIAVMEAYGDKPARCDYVQCP